MGFIGPVELTRSVGVELWDVVADADVVGVDVDVAVSLDVGVDVPVDPVGLADVVGLAVPLDGDVEV